MSATSVEHQWPEPELLVRKAGQRRHIETERRMDGTIERREWWWEWDTDPCSTAPGQVRAQGAPR